jgi:hypothetical protein
MSIDLTDPPRTSPEVLIPEARQRQRHRYVRTAVILTLSAFLLAGLLAAAVAAWGGTTGGKTQPGSPVATNTARSHVYFRPVLCFAPSYNPAQSIPATSDQPSCTPASAVTVRNLNVQPNSKAGPAGFSSDFVSPDSALAGVPSTKASADKPSATVLLPGIRRACNQTPANLRCVLGPAQMTNRLIRSATAEHNQYGWVVNYTMSAAGSVLWDRVASENFHQELAIELNGIVYSAPLIQPTQTSFTSFDGKGEISGSLTKADATRLATAMNSR